MVRPKGKALGKGLGALIEETVTEHQTGEIDISLIDICATQPRKYFDDGKLDELAESIRTHGIIQPLILKKTGERYMIIAGERRFRAARKAGLTSLPAIVKDVDKRELLELSIIENIQREDLNPIEAAEAMEMLMQEHGLTQEELSKRIGKSRSAIANALRLLNLPQKTRECLASGALSEGHAKVLLSLKDSVLIDNAAAHIIEKGLSVRETEAYIKTIMNPAKKKKEKQQAPEILAAEKELGESLATKVEIRGGGKKGKILIEYYTAEQLDRIYEFLKSASL